MAIGQLAPENAMSNEARAKRETADDGKEAGNFPAVLPPDFIVGSDRLDRLRQMGFSNDEIYAIVAPRRTLDRRIQTGRMLSAGESDRVLRLERVHEHAERTLGSRDKAGRWLRKENRALGGAIPIRLLESETGAYMVEEVLTRIDFGMFS